jgi:hypothetical protein
MNSIAGGKGGCRHLSDACFGPLFVVMPLHGLLL